MTNGLRYSVGFAVWVSGVVLPITIWVETKGGFGRFLPLDLTVIVPLIVQILLGLPFVMMCSWIGGRFRGSLASILGFFLGGGSYFLVGNVAANFFNSLGMMKLAWFLALPLAFACALIAWLFRRSA